MAAPLAQGKVLHKAVRNNDVERVKYLIENGPPGMINQIYTQGITALHIAAALNNTQMIELLIKAGANPDAQTEQGFTPAHWAASRDSRDALDALVRSGANLTNKATETGVTALHWASQNNATNCIAFLLGVGADLHAETSSKLNPLHWAVRTQAEDAALLLAIEGEYRDARDENIAAKKFSPAIPTLLPKMKRVKAGKALKVPLARMQKVDFVWIDSLELWSGKFEITNAQFQHFKPNHRAECAVELDLNLTNLPAVSVTWTEAHGFGEWLTTYYGKLLPKGYTFRLPTEHEWTRLASCGKPNQTYPWGDEWPPQYGNYSDISCKAVYTHWRGVEEYNDGYVATCPVALSGKNEWGLYGIGGNAWEWCSNWFDASEKYKVRRGASWKFDQKDALRIQKRGLDRPSARYNNIGFRIVAAPAAE